MLTLTKSSFPWMEVQPFTHQEFWVWTSALTGLATSHCVHVLGYETLQLPQAQWVCFVVFNFELHSMLYRRNTKQKNAQY